MANLKRETGQNHKKKFEKWQVKLGAESKILSDFVIKNIIPELEIAGYRWVDFGLLDSNLIVDCNEIRLEKCSEEYIDYIELLFDKYGRAIFQIYGGRNRNSSAHEIVRRASITKTSNQYYYFWGKPWWMPSALWTPKYTSQITLAVRKLVPQLIEFIDSGERGPNIGRSVTITLDQIESRKRQS